MPTSVESALALTSVTGGGGSGVGLAMTEDYEARRALDVAQSTVGSLRERLAQKEDTLKRYEGLMKQSRNETEETVQKLQVRRAPLLYTQSGG